MLQITAILFIYYVVSIIIEFRRAEEHWEEIQRDSEEEK